ncbi:hypothetical protein DRH14_04635 [Candidatus Shapirobacteria bacterium]|nr:MAG: hypothetical protein DRH14_04635 [Candidatus Shapirobacteria bacterium]
MKGKVGVFRERKDCVLRIRVSRRVMMELRRIAKRKGRYVSELVRREIYEMLRREKKENVLH